jgi:3-oxoacyl-[acyl-carrier-protein] synthase II
MRSEPDAADRVVVTGVGPVSAIGAGRAAFWPALLAGRSGVGPVRAFDPAPYPVGIAAEIPDFDPAPGLRPAHRGAFGRTSGLACAAARLALADAGLDALPDGETAIIVGTTMGECQLQETIATTWAHAGLDRLDPAVVRAAPDSAVAVNVARELDVEADAWVVPTACAAGNYAIGFGYDRVRSGECQVALVGGADAFSRIAFTGFGRMLSLAPDRCRPFDRDRQGIVVGEGAGLLVLESLARARARGAPALAELRGYGLSCDAHHMTIPSVDGIAAVMERALARSRVAPESVSYVSAHGTGTRINDRTECEAIRRVFGPRAGRLPVSSIKSMLGHAMGAASALEAIACVLAVHEGRVPPTINFETPDPECPVDCVAEGARELPVEVALNNAFAFGGNNAATVFAHVA